MQPEIKITLDPRSFADADKEIARILAEVEDKSKLTRVLGEALLDATRKHFEDEESPDGAAWAAHRPLTLALRAGKGGKGILRLRGKLYGEMHYTVSGNTVTVKTAPLAYANIHQHGGVVVAKGKPLAIPFKAGFAGKDGKRANKAGLIFLMKVTIPARPYMGWGKIEEQNVREAVGSWLAGG